MTNQDNQPPPNYKLEISKCTTKGKTTVRLRDERGDIVHCDEINTQKKQDRDKFIANIDPGRGVDPKAVERDLVAYEPTSSEPAPSFLGDEIDVSQVFRPERIILPELSAISVPILRSSGNGVIGEWQLYSCTPTERSKSPLKATIECGGQRYFAETVPSAPIAQGQRGGWSRGGRSQFSEGAEADAVALFKKLVESLDRYLEFPPEKQHGYTCLLACWIVLTYSYHAWDAVPYLLVNGPAGSGKSTLFGILRALVFRPFATDNVSAAAIYRTLNEFGGTLLFDEAERLRDTKSPDVAEVNSMLLAGYQRGRCATRMEKVKDSFKTVNYDVFGPKAIACINGVQAALQTRCIEIQTERAASGSPKPKHQMGDTDWQSIRDDLFLLAITNGQAWIEASKRQDVGTSINGRDFELWQPLLAIAAFFEDAGIEDLVSLLSDFAVESVAESAELSVPEAEGCMLLVLAEATRSGIVTAKGIRVYQPTAGEILYECKDREPSIFHNYSAKGVATRLRHYGLKTSPSNGRREFRPLQQKLEDIQERYSIDLGFGS